MKKQGQDEKQDEDRSSRFGWSSDDGLTLIEPPDGFKPKSAKSKEAAARYQALRIAHAEKTGKAEEDIEIPSLDEIDKFVSNELEHYLPDDVKKELVTTANKKPLNKK